MSDISSADFPQPSQVAGAARANRMAKTSPRAVDIAPPDPWDLRQTSRISAMSSAQSSRDPRTGKLDRKPSNVSSVSSAFDEDGDSMRKQKKEKKGKSPNKGVSSSRRASVKRAMRRADHAGPMFFTGEEALREVAKPDGAWNWALVGPDPRQLPLVGGGAGSVKEMRSAIGKHAHSYGLLRMTFGVEAKAKTKFLFIHAADDIDSGSFTARERGQALAVEPAMHKAIYSLHAFAAKVQLHSPSECTVEYMIDRLRSVVCGMDEKVITLENFYAAIEYHRLAHPEQQQAVEEKQEHTRMAEQLAEPLPEAAQPELVTPLPTGELGHSASQRQRRKVKAYPKGAVVEIYSLRHNAWIFDGEVTDMVDETRVIDGAQVVAGSVKVVFLNGTQFEWVAPQQISSRLRTSSRPAPPDTMCGTLQKETHSWWAYWHMRYVEVKGGFFRWWADAVQAATGNAEKQGLYLLGMQLTRQGNEFTVKSNNSGGEIYKFKADTEKDAAAWEKALWLHAGYCEEVNDSEMAKKGSQMVQSELHSAFGTRR